MKPTKPPSTFSTRKPSVLGSHARLDSAGFIWIRAFQHRDVVLLPEVPSALLYATVSSSIPTIGYRVSARSTFDGGSIESNIQLLSSHLLNHTRAIGSIRSSEIGGFSTGHAHKQSTRRRSLDLVRAC
ncbi:hypothetical protein RSAG8_10794, partial [Rhizoctonia solani AG-8 WAC10335]